MDIIQPYLDDPQLVKELVLPILNYTMIGGAVLIKAPQIVNIIVRRSVDGLSEAAFLLELIACSSSALYNMKMGHPFKSWGEMALISVQCFIQIILYWAFKRGISLLPRIVLMAALVGLAGAIHLQPLGEGAALLALGIVPTVTGQISRFPQILQNFKQGHTGNLSIVTWGLSCAGCAVRILTTIMQIDDPIQLLSHVVAGIANGMLFMQILVYWSRTQAALATQAGKKEK